MITHIIEVKFDVKIGDGIMKINYSDLSFEEIRKMALNDELSHLDMKKEDYDFLFKNEMELEEPSPDVIEFCQNGFRRYKKKKDKAINQNRNQMSKTVERFESDMRILAKQLECKLMSYEELREAVLKGELEHEYMSEPAYRLLYENESALSRPNAVIIDFCAKGLKDTERIKEALKDYSILSFNELREMILSGSLSHEYMTIELYGFILCNESGGEDYAVINDNVIQFCIDGLIRYDEYVQLKEYKKLNEHSNLKLKCAKAFFKKIKKNMEKIYNSYCYEQLRGDFLYGVLKHEFMTRSAYELLLHNEIQIYIPNTAILQFCADGLKRFGAYKKTNDVDIIDRVVRRQTRKERREARSIFRTPQRAALAAFATFGLILTVGMTVNAMGYDIIDLSGKLVKNIFSDKKSTEYNGKSVIVADEARIYGSLDEMIETENLNILYPEKLPDGYMFTDFRIVDMGNYIKLRAYASEPFIDFVVKIGADVKIDKYDYETNGIKYNISEMANGMYQAVWSYNNKDCYEIAVRDKADISLIINNFK
jgi:hypothetical protein